MCHAGSMSDVVPPGGDRPVEDEPWPTADASRGRHAPDDRLPSVPPDVSDVPASPPDWRTFARATSGAAPPGFVQPGEQSPYTIRRMDVVGVTATVVAAAGALQLIVFPLPFLSVLAIALGFSGRRSGRLDPDGVRGRLWSNVGIALGAAGVSAGVALVLGDVSTLLTP